MRGNHYANYSATFVIFHKDIYYFDIPNILTYLFSPPYGKKKALHTFSQATITFSGIFLGKMFENSRRYITFAH